MKRFKFKLENVLSYRVTLEGLAKNNYQEAVRLLNLEKERLVELEKTRHDLMVAYNNDMRVGAVIHPDQVILWARYSSQLAAMITLQHKRIIEKQKIVQEKFQEWNRRRKDVKVIEKLKEKRWQQYLKDIEKEDQKFQDEIFLAKKIREGMS